jgi:hypothetical protein
MQIIDYDNDFVMLMADPGNIPATGLCDRARGPPETDGTQIASRMGATHEPYTADGDIPSRIAMQLGMGFVHHDERNRDAALEAFAAVDAFQFQHVSETTARRAATAYVDALWEKDDIEAACTDDGEYDREALEAADWSPVRESFARRADLVGTDPRYADRSTTAWRRHKTGGDYWTPMQRAQLYELRTALQDPDYPHKSRGGQSGCGPEPARYVLGVELHDTRRFEEGLEAMTPYFERIAGAHGDWSSDEWTV